jgi:hypothetical protein
VTGVTSGVAWEPARVGRFGGGRGGGEAQARPASAAAWRATGNGPVRRGYGWCTASLTAPRTRSIVGSRAGTGTAFRFEPVTFAGPQGKITAELSGVLARRRASDRRCG